MPNSTSTTLPNALPSVQLLTFILAALTAVTPLAVDMYLPAMQQMALTLQEPIHHVELSLSIFLLGYAFGQLFGGPASDKFGRLPIIQIGLITFIIASVFLAQATTLTELMVLRVIQAIGGGLATVNTAAIIRDLFDGKKVAKMLSMIAVIMMMAPLLAPLMGAFLVQLVNWQSIFYFLAAYAFLILLIVRWQLIETRDKNIEVAAPWHNYWQVLTHRQAMAHVLAITMAFCGMFVFLTASPFAYMEHFQVSEDVFAYLFACNILTMIAFNRVNIWALRKTSSKNILMAGQSLQLVSGLLLIACSYFSAPLALVVIGNALFVGSIGLIAGNAVAGCLHYFPKTSGTANALIGVVEFICGAIAGFIWSLLHDGSLMPMAIMMTLCAVIGIVSFILLFKPAPQENPSA